MTMSPRALRLALVLVPATTLLGAYLWMAVDHGTARLWSVVVHEGGRYTLGETIAYYRHFLRELPVVVTYAAATSAAAATYGPGRAGAPSSRERVAALAAAALVVMGAWAG